MDSTPQALEEVVQIHLRHRTTFLVPTIVACNQKALSRLFQVFRQSKGWGRGLGIHMDGPFISQEMHGVQNPNCLRCPTPNETDWLLDTAGDLIVRMSAAPELPGLPEMTDNLYKRGIRLSVAHSNATCQDILRAYDLGFTHITYLYSNTPSVRKISQDVYTGVVKAAYLLDGMTVEMIGDGKHVPKEMMKIIFKETPHNYHMEYAG